MDSIGQDEGQGDKLLIRQLVTACITSPLLATKFCEAEFFSIPTDTRWTSNRPANADRNCRHLHLNSTVTESTYLSLLACAASSSSLHEYFCPAAWLQCFLIWLYSRFLLHELGPSYVYTWFILKMPGGLASNRVGRHAL